MDLEMLNGKIYKSKVTRAEICQALDITYTTLKRRTTGVSPFKVSEAIKISELLELTPEEREEIFFT